jgi:hypothetical protein
MKLTGEERMNDECFCRMASDWPGGEGRIRTSEGIANRFTVCPLWPLGNLSDAKSPFSRLNNFLPAKKKNGKSMSYICGKKAYKIFNLLYLTDKTFIVKKYFYSISFRF